MHRICIATSCCALLAVTCSAQEVRFDRDIRPILSDACFACHGPDAGQRQAGLRLDSFDAATAVLESDAIAIVPGSPENSELLRRVTTHDEDERMPPADSGKSLTAHQIDLLKRWISGGAEYTAHWSLVKPKRPVPPQVPDSEGIQNPIDNFIRAQLQQRGLRPSPPASRETLIRRVTLALTGLPPTVQEIDDFLADDSEDAWETVVDRLLASKHYGEHMTRYWLDAARYGDTHGLHLDNLRSIYPYRDWVIRAFNDNMPFDRFTIEQLAGDLLPDATLEQKVATGFNRCNVTTSEGGAIPEEWLVRYAVDRVNTTSTVWMGLTVGCAQCHDHKFDPITQREYYQLFAYFNGLTEKAMDGNKPLPPPIVRVPTPQQREDEQELLQTIARLKGSVEQREAAALAELDAWEQSVRDGSNPLPQPPEDTLFHFPLDEGKGRQVRSDSTLGTLAGNPQWVDGRNGKALQLARNGHVDVPGACGDFEHTDAFSYAAWVRPADRGVSVVMSRMDDASAFRGWDMYLSDGRVYVHLIHAWPGNAIRVNTGDVLPAGKWVHLAATWDGSGKAAGVRVYVNGVSQPLQITHDSLTGTIRTEKNFRIGRRTDSSPAAATLDDIRIYARVLMAPEIRLLAGHEDLRSLLAIAKEKRTPEQAQSLRDAYLLLHEPDLVAARTKLSATEARLKALREQFPGTLVMEDMPQPRDTWVLNRGEYDQPDKDQKVLPGTPAALPPLPPDAKGNRLDLARWLVSPEHPLTARVAVNRFWQQHFGTGLVRTAEDFGSQGEWPTHPELLDWLATEFMESGWDVKHIQKLIVMSATFAQSSAVREELLERDPENRLLARGPRFRMDAETIRDQALFVSGLLNPEIGGPSVKPPQPAGLWKEVGYTDSNTANFRPDTGDKIYRRSLYTFWKRTSPPPTMAVFDAPTREECIVRRARTNTPLQALVLMNEVQFVEAARHLAARALREGGATDDQRLTFAFRCVTARRPSASELEVLRQALAEQSQLYASDREAAVELLSVGDSPVIQGLDPVRHASWTMVANLLLNLDETITRN